MSIKEQIRAEIERRKNTAETMRERGAYIGLLDYIDTLPEQPVDGRLEMAARHVWESWNGGTMDEVRRDMKALGNVLNARKEQPVEYPTSTEMIAEWENNELPMLREKDFRGDAERMAYNAFMDGFAKGLGYKK